VARLLELMSEVPAFVNNGRGDVLAANPLAEALLAPMFDAAAPPVDHAGFAFLDPRARDFWIDWNRIASDIVAMLRTEAGRDPYDKGLTDLVGKLSTRSEDFRTRWAAQVAHGGPSRAPRPPTASLAAFLPRCADQPYPLIFRQDYRNPLLVTGSAHRLDTSVTGTHPDFEHRPIPPLRHGHALQHTMECHAFKTPSRTGRFNNVATAVS
jgi:hypothetical protein